MSVYYLQFKEEILCRIFQFIENEWWVRKSNQCRRDIKNSKDNSLESKLDRLKLMRDKGVLHVMVDLEYVNKLLEKYGL